MPGHDDLDAHLGRALDNRVKVVHLEPQQYTVSIWLVGSIADRNVMVADLEAMQLKNQLALVDQLLVFGTPVAAPAAQQTLIPPATCFHIGYGDEWLRAH
jgi:hypothetical protein